MAISRAADSGESEPCTMFSWTFLPQSRPRSPRIVPGSAADGSVAPASARKPSMQRCPSMTMAARLASDEGRREDGQG